MAKHALLRLVLVLMVLGFVIGCERMVVQKPEPEPPAPVLTLVGSWLWTDTFVDDEDGQTYTETKLLTFTSGGRAVEHNVVLDASGTQIDDWVNESEWVATDSTTVTRSWHDDHDDDDETPQVLREVPKAYYWGEDRQTVFLTPWGYDGPTAELHRMVRVADPLPDLAGRWVLEHEEPGHVSVVVFGDDGAITMEDENPERTWRLTGTMGEVDPETLIAPLSDLQSQPFVDGVATRDPASWNMGAGQIGIVPSATGGIIISPPWDERNTEAHPHGNYWMVLSRDDS